MVVPTQPRWIPPPDGIAKTWVDGAVSRDGKCGRLVPCVETHRAAFWVLRLSKYME